MSQRWPVPCEHGLTALVDGVSDMLQAHATVEAIGTIAKDHPGRQGVACLLNGDVAAAIYGSVVFVRNELAP